MVPSVWHRVRFRVAMNELPNSDDTGRGGGSRLIGVGRLPFLKTVCPTRPAAATKCEGLLQRPLAGVEADAHSFWNNWQEQ